MKTGRKLFRPVLRLDLRLLGADRSAERCNRSFLTTLLDNRFVLRALARRHLTNQCEIVTLQPE